MDQDITNLFIYIIFIVILLIFWKQIYGFIGYGILKGYNKDLKVDPFIDELLETKITIPNSTKIYPTPWE